MASIHIARQQGRCPSASKGRARPLPGGIPKIPEGRESRVIPLRRPIPFRPHSLLAAGQGFGNGGYADA